MSHIEPINSRSFAHIVGTAILGAVSTCALSRLAQCDWTRALFYAGTAGLLGGAVCWRHICFKSLTIEEEKCVSLIRRKWEAKGEKEDSDLEQAALKWYTQYCRPYQRAKSEEEKQKLKQDLRQFLCKRSEFTILVFLWLVEEFEEAAFFCLEVFEEEALFSDPFFKGRLASAFKTAEDKEEIPQGGLVDRWRLFVALYVACFGAGVSREVAQKVLKKIGQQGNDFSFEEKGRIFGLVLAWNCEEEDRIIKHFPSLPFFMQEYVLAVLLKNHELNLDNNVLQNILVADCAQIGQLFALGQQTFDPGNHFSIILHLQKMAREPHRAPFRVQAFLENPPLEAPSSQDSDQECRLLTFSSEGLFKIVEHLSIFDHSSWCRVSKSFCNVGKSQNYWWARCQVDFGIMRKPQDKPWSQVYQDAYYCNRWVVARFREAAQAVHEDWMLPTAAYPFLVLSQQQVESIFSQGEITQFSTREKQLENNEASQKLPFIWLSSLKNDQAKLLAFLKQLFFKSSSEDALYSQKQRNIWSPYVMGLCVDETSLTQILQWINEATIQSKEWEESKKMSFLKIKEDAAVMLSNRFEITYIDDLLFKLGLQNCFPEFKCFQETVKKKIGDG